MHMAIRKFVLVGCLGLPLISFAASEDRESEKRAKADQQLAAKIQKAVAKDQSLAISSRNVTVSVQGGAVTLAGSVQSYEERQAIQGKAESLVLQEQKAHSAAPPDIRNKLTVVPSK